MAASVSLNKDFALELIETNLAVVRKDIRRILSRWQVKSSQEMIEMTEKGELREAEVDALALTNLIDKEKELEGLHAFVDEA